MSTKIDMNQREIVTTIDKTIKAIPTMKDGIGGIENKASEILKNMQVSKVIIYFFFCFVYWG